MFILRVIKEHRKSEKVPFEQTIDNYCIGNYYSVLKKGITKEFDLKYECLNNDFLNNDCLNTDIEKEAGAIILGGNKDNFLVMKDTSLRRNSYFIMTEKGEVFEEIKI